MIHAMTSAEEKEIRERLDRLYGQGGVNDSYSTHYYVMGLLSEVERLRKSEQLLHELSVALAGATTGVGWLVQCDRRLTEIYGLVENHSREAQR